MKSKDSTSQGPADVGMDTISNSHRAFKIYGNLVQTDGLGEATQRCYEIS